MNRATVRAAMPKMQPGPCLRRSARGAALGALLAASSLCGCSSDGPLKLPLPPQTDVPVIAHDSYPTIGATTRTGRPVLTEPQRSKLQGDLERSSTAQASQVQATIQAGN